MAIVRNVAPRNVRTANAHSTGSGADGRPDRIPRGQSYEHLQSVQNILAEVLQRLKCCGHMSADSKFARAHAKRMRTTTFRELTASQVKILDAKTRVQEVIDSIKESLQLGEPASMHLKDFLASARVLVLAACNERHALFPSLENGNWPADFVHCELEVRKHAEVALELLQRAENQLNQ